MNYDVIFFDLDGTLSDPAEGITNSIRHALNKVGLDASRQDLLKFIGPPLMESYQKYYPEMDPKKGLEDFREYFSVKGLYENQLYPDTISTLKTLKDMGYCLAVATSKPEEYSKTIIEHFGLAPYFDGVYGADMEETRVKKADIIAYAIEELEKTRPVKNPLMVGDRLHDIEGAHANNIQAVGVLCGYGSKEELEEAGADYIIETLEDLPRLLQKIR